MRIPRRSGMGDGTKFPRYEYTFIFTCSGSRQDCENPNMDMNPSWMVRKNALLRRLRRVMGSSGMATMRISDGWSACRAGAPDKEVGAPDEEIETPMRFVLQILRNCVVQPSDDIFHRGRTDMYTRSVSAPLGDIHTRTYTTACLHTRHTMY